MRQVRRHIFSRISLMVLATMLMAAGGQQACGKKIDTDKMIKEMLTGRETQTKIPYLTRTYGSFGIKKAYRIQMALAKELSKKLGSVVGYKVAYASKAVQKQFGIMEPASGPFFRLQRVPSGSKLPASHFMDLLLETEIAFTIGKRIDHAIKDVAEIKDYVRWVHTAFDAGEHRFVEGDSKPTAADAIASGVGAHVFVLGPATDPSKIDVDAISLKLIRNGKIIEDSAATNVMGSPWNSLLWCANHIVKLGGTLEPGMVIVSGTAAPAYIAKGDEKKGEYVGDCGPLGKVTMTLY
ncbi:MAG: fumarylacetoacetate hydrolase family protein [Phycisphaerales bacterium]|nr:MAG: fumarylacetoacetate hydrolase family protein [Phycisphaerales bacterium]